MDKTAREKQLEALKPTMWERGQPSPNPNGRPRRVLRQLEEKVGIEFSVSLSKEDKFQIIESLLELSVDDLEKIAKDRSAPAFVVTVAGALRDDIQKRRMYSAESIFDRIFGKPKQTTEIDQNIKGTIAFSDLTDEQIADERKRLAERLAKFGA